MDNNDFSSIIIGLASPSEILSMSHGEVTSPDTVNYKTYKPAPGGLLCERIFGPSESWSCYCKKYNGIRFKNIRCEICGVEVVDRRVRRERFGHIELVTPVVHPWFFQQLPSIISGLLSIPYAKLDKIIYCELYIVIRAGDASAYGIKDLAIIDEDRYFEILNKIKMKIRIGRIKNKIEEWEKDNENGHLDSARVFKVLKILNRIIREGRDEDGNLDSIIASGISETLNRIVKKDNNDDDLDSTIFEILDEIEKGKGNNKNESLNSTTISKISEIFNKVVNDSSNEDDDLDSAMASTEMYDTTIRDIYDVDDEETGFIVKTGGEAIEILLKNIDLEYLEKSLTERIRSSSSASSQSYLSTLKVVKAFISSKKTHENRPEWMVIRILPVIPPDLRPLVIVDGKVTTVDLNELYRTIIIRNNRLRQLIEVGAPDIILRNEKRMLQEAVNVLIDNSSPINQVTNKNRPLKSFTDILKGKQGMFRQNLLGKRVDYSGRSVIVIGPELKIYECGLPKDMAVELFSPFIIGRLLERGMANSIKEAKKIINKNEDVVFEILEKVIKGYPVILNRAPTLHKMSIQAFQPKLIESKAIQIHPLVCAEFNADFDGDQMAVHIPLTQAAINEASILMLSSNNLLKAADGNPSFVPNHDIVLGIYYLTKQLSDDDDNDSKFVFYSPEEVIIAFNLDKVSIHTRIKVRLNDQKIIETTVGRVIFNNVLPEDFSFVNEIVTKQVIKQVVLNLCKDFHSDIAIRCLDDIKQLGFYWAYKSGISFNMNDIIIPSEKNDIVLDSQRKIKSIVENYKIGLITNKERYNRTIDIWSKASIEIMKKLMFHLEHDKGGFNSIYMMLHSGARGSKEQVRQLSGIRGLISKSNNSKQGSDSSNIIEIPIVSNFKEGLDVSEYFISSYGGRKGMTDTALKTANAGYLTRRLVDVVQDVVITDYDCNTKKGISIFKFDNSNESQERTFSKKIARKITVLDIKNPVTGEIIVEKGGEIDEDKAKIIEECGIDNVYVRSILSCESPNGFCSKCYGINLATNKIVQEGEAVGIIAAQSIGEPGTQLTLNTFHAGGAASSIEQENSKKSSTSGVVKFENVEFIDVNKKGKSSKLVVGYYGELQILDNTTGTTLSKYNIPYGATLYVDDKASIEKDTLLFEWDPYNYMIISTVSGIVKYEGLEEGITYNVIYNAITGENDKVVVRYKDNSTACITVENKQGEKGNVYNIPVKAHLLVNEGEHVDVGDIIAKVPRNIKIMSDITGGLPRVIELFEAQNPVNATILSEIDGCVRFGQIIGKKQEIFVESKNFNISCKYSIPLSADIFVQNGDFIRAGHQLCSGVVSCHDVLNIYGIIAAYNFLINELQNVYEQEGVTVSSKHIEVIIKRMFDYVEVIDSGDTNFVNEQLILRNDFIRTNNKYRWKMIVTDSGDSEKYKNGDLVFEYDLNSENKKLEESGLRQMTVRKVKHATGRIKIQGITQVALKNKSFLSSASFQETTKILTAAAISGAEDNLCGLKENIITGHLIPAGTGYRKFANEKVYCTKNNIA